MDQALVTTLGRRASQRICLHRDVGVLDEQSGTRVLGCVHDVSATGASVATPAPLQVGRELRLAFEFDPGQPPIRLHAEVVWSGKETAPAGSTLAGLKFTQLAGDDFLRLRSYIERKLWSIQSFLCSVDLFADFSDMEKLLLASVVVDRELHAESSLEPALCDGTLAVVRSGTVACCETVADARTTGRRTAEAGHLFGSLPIDPRGLSRISALALTDASLLLVTADGFRYLQEAHSELALKLVATWALALRDSLLVVEPRR